MLVIFRPQLLSARTADSRPGPGPPTRTSTFFTPCSCAAVPAFSAATCAANGVDLREPRKPQPPEVAQESVLPWRSVIVMIVLLKEACTCAIASSTFLRAFFGFFAAGAAAPPPAAGFAFSSAIQSALCLSGRCVELDRLLARALAGARVGARALAAHRQSAAVADAAPAAEVHEALDVHRHLAPQVALDGELGDLRADGVHLRLGQVLDLGGRVDTRGGTGGARARPAHAVDVGEPDPHVLVHRDVGAGYACHVRLPQP